MGGRSCKHRLRWFFTVLLIADAGCWPRGGPGSAGVTDIGSDRRAGAAADGRVAGRAVDLATKQPLAGRLVVVGGQQAVTDASGGFTFEGVPPRYDLFIAEPDRSSVSIYRGLKRRDPLVVHRAILRAPVPGSHTFDCGEYKRVVPFGRGVGCVNKEEMSGLLQS